MEYAPYQHMRKHIKPKPRKTRTITFQPNEPVAKLIERLPSNKWGERTEWINQSIERGNKGKEVK